MSEGSITFGSKFEDLSPTRRVGVADVHKPQLKMNQLVDTHRPTLVDTNDLARRLPAGLPTWLLEQLLHFTGLAELNQIYASLGARMAFENPFRSALDCLRIRTIVDKTTITRIPEAGPAIVVANHPFGGADGLAIGALAIERRRDVRVLVNSWLEQIDLLKPWLIPVDVFDAKRKAMRNVAAFRTALRHLQEGGLLVVFPAGTVSQLNPLNGKIEDVAWNPGMATLARLSRATVVPCYFQGNNRPLFHLAGMIHESLRTALLARELIAKQESIVSIAIGREVRPESLERFATDEQRVAWLRVRTYSLESSIASIGTEYAEGAPLSPAIPAQHISRELAQLPKQACLISQGPYRVYFATAFDLPRTVQEIGRLREQTFRAVSEGTGKSTDIDRFDSSYHHLVLWDEPAQRIVGAYRLAFCDKRLNAQGFEGLYLNTLFRFNKAQRRQLTTCIELGRSFIRPEYQKKPLPLALLWRGIGEVLCRNPSYRTLLGPVSISRNYRGSSKRLLLQYLKSVGAPPEWRSLASARHPVQLSLSDSELSVLRAKDLSAKTLSSLISELDDEGKRIPVLVERYLELGAWVLDLNHDPDFSDCIDALVVVDLSRAPAPILRRFMGVEGASRFAQETQLAS